jgi:hypothetical protein
VTSDEEENGVISPNPAACAKDTAGTNTNSSDDDVASHPQEDTPFQITALPVLGWPYYQNQHETKPQPGANVILVREKTNEHDPNAIAAYDGDKKPLGHICRHAAGILAPLMDAHRIQITQVSIATALDRSFRVKVSGTSDGSDICNVVLDSLCQDSKVQAEETSHTIAKKDVERASTAWYTFADLKALPWAPSPEWKPDSSATTFEHWLPDPFDASKFNNPPLSLLDVNKVKSWPPSDDILLRLGLAPANDDAWWRNVAGLRPPNEWLVAGALDVTPQVSVSQTHKVIAAKTLAGAIHGVNNVWHEDMLRDMQRVMEGPNFWCRRSADALIRAFGGPYILGQEEGKLKLVRGAPHTELTRKCCLIRATFLVEVMFTRSRLVPLPLSFREDVYCT